MAIAIWTGIAIDGLITGDGGLSNVFNILGDIEPRTDWNEAGKQLDDSSGKGNNLQLATGYAGEFVAANSDTTVSKNLGNCKAFDFWTQLGSTTEPILDLNGTNHIDVASGTIDLDGGTSEAYYVNGVAGSTITTDWTHVVISQATDINVSAMRIALIAAGYGDLKIKDLRFYSTELSAAQALEAYNNPQQEKPTGATLVASYLTGQSYITDNFVIFDNSGNGNHLTFLSAASSPYLAHIDNIAVGKQVALSGYNKYPWFGPIAQNWSIASGTNANISPLGVGQYVEITFFWFNTDQYLPFNYLLIQASGKPRIQVNGVNLNFTIGSCVNNAVNTVRITRTATNDFKYTLNGVDQQTLTAAGTDSNFLFTGTSSGSGSDNGICIKIDMNGTVYTAQDEFAPMVLGSSSGATPTPRWVNICENITSAGNDIFSESLKLAYFDKQLNFLEYITGSNKTTAINIGTVKTLVFLLRAIDKDVDVTIAETGTGNTITISSGNLVATDFDTVDVDNSGSPALTDDTWHFIALTDAIGVNLSAFAIDQNATGIYLVNPRAYQLKAGASDLATLKTELEAYLP